MHVTVPYTVSSTYLKIIRISLNGLVFKNYINIKNARYRYIFIYIFFRCTWLVIVLTSFVCASILVQIMWLKFNSSPTVTAVKDTHLALYSLPFPAVNVCPMDKIKRSAAYSYISSRINSTYQEYQMDYFLNILSLFQHPLYSRMSYYLNDTGMPEFLSKLSSINVTDFMLNVSRYYTFTAKPLLFLHLMYLPTVWIGPPKSSTST